jgi:nanoRNase/pAp phosphatase (c-di-AMP/oligoRNAs hydrolase)
MRLITRSDFDGLVCAVLLREAQLVEDYRFVHPKDVQDGSIAVNSDDVLANVPYAAGCGLWFDHHLSEQSRGAHPDSFEGDFREAPSCARVIWDYYGGRERFGAHFEPMMEAVDRSDSANLTVDDIERPEGWILLSYVMDPRTGLGRYRDYRVSNYQLMEALVEECRSRPIDEILQLPDVQERLKRYHEQTDLFRAMVRRNSTPHGNVVLLDLRDEPEIFAGNRFVVYTMYPEANVSIQAIWGLKQQNTVFTVGHSITNRTCRTNVGDLMLQYGGGGHRGVGTCQVPNELAERTLQELIDALKEPQFAAERQPELVGAGR